MKTEHFPTRVYDGVTLPEGDYESLILYLGSGEGDNWWCVAYPPLCFSSAGGANVAYKSLILEKSANGKSARLKMSGALQAEAKQTYGRE